MKTMEIKNVLSKNTIALVKAKKLNLTSLAKKSGAGYGSCQRVTSPDEGEKNSPNLKNINKISKALEVSVWKLFFPNLPVKLMEDERLEKSIQMLVDCSDENRLDIYEHIQKVYDKDRMEKELRELKDKKQ